MAMDDLELAREYASRKSEDAFTTLVSRHVDMVYSVALRQVGNAHQAEEITQAVFLTLARKAGSLRNGTILSGWLFQTTRLTAANFMRSEMRRIRREQEAYMESLEPGESVWREISPKLNDAIGNLNAADRDAIILRFIEGKNLQEVGAALGISEEAAKKRVSRALEKLRMFFQSEKMELSSERLSHVIQAHAVESAPAALGALIVTQVLNASAVQASTLTLMKTTLSIMKWMKIKTAIITLLLLGAATGGIISVTTALTAEKKETPKATKTTPAVTASRKVLLFRNEPSWNRKRDFEEVLTELGFNFEVKTSSDMGTIDLAPYSFVIIPGAQPKDYYEDYTTSAARFDRYVTGGGTLVLELNGAEDNNLTLPAGVTMAKNGARDNLITVPDHPILVPFQGKQIHASYASHGYLQGLPEGALTLATETTGSQPALDRPTFAEYALGKGHVIAACQCFHDRDNSKRGILMPTLVSYAAEREWYSAKK
jgi:RNA polymerase sigma factor (sigma-70 family)